MINLYRNVLGVTTFNFANDSNIVGIRPTNNVFNNYLNLTIFLGRIKFQNTNHNTRNKLPYYFDRVFLGLYLARRRKQKLSFVEWKHQVADPYRSSPSTTHHSNNYCVIKNHSPRNRSNPISLTLLAKYNDNKPTGIAAQKIQDFQASKTNSCRSNTHPKIKAHVPKNRVYTGKTTVANNTCVNRGKNTANNKLPTKAQPAPNKYETPQANNQPIIGIDYTIDLQMYGALSSGFVDYGL